jgi:hypothetical protein
MARCTHCGNYISDGDTSYSLPSLVSDGRIFCCEGCEIRFYGEEKLQSLMEMNAVLSGQHRIAAAKENARQARIRAIRSLLFFIILTVTALAAYFLVPAVPAIERFSADLQPIAFVLVTVLAVSFTKPIRKRVVTNIIYNKLFNFLMTALVFLTLFFAGMNLVGLDLNALVDGIKETGFAQDSEISIGGAVVALIVCLILRKRHPFGRLHKFISALIVLIIAFTVIQFMGISVGDIIEKLESFLQ